MSSVKIPGWKGLRTNVSPHLLGEGELREMVNFVATVPGVLQGRKGIVPLALTGYSSEDSSQIIAMRKFERPEANWIVYEKANGSVKAIRDGGQQTIATGRNTFQPLCLIRDRKGFLYGFDGLGRGFRWDGLTSVAQNAGIDAPAAAPTVTASGSADPVSQTVTLSGRNLGGTFTLTLNAQTTGAIAFNASPFTIQSELSALSSIVAGNVAVSGTSGSSGGTYKLIFSGSVPSLVLVTASSSLTGTGAAITVASADTYDCYYAYLDRDGNQSCLSPVITLNATDGDTFSWTVAWPSDSRVSRINLYRSTRGESSVVYLAGTITDPMTTTYSDTNGDDTLSADDADALPIFKDNGDLSANRFVPPPTDRPFVAIFQDRAFFYGTVSYTEGTVAVTSGNATVTGTGNTFNNAMIGREFVVAGDTRAYTITGTTSSTLTISPVYAGSTASGLPYAVKPTADRLKSIDWSEPDEIESVPPVNNDPVQENVDDSDPPTGLMPYQSFLWMLNERHVYRLSFVQQPGADIGIILAGNRGCTNNRCWVVAEGTAFCLDQMGVWYTNGGDPQELSADIQNIFQDGTIDWTYAKNFWAEFEPTERVVKFYVCYSVDTGTTAPPAEPILDNNSLPILDNNGQPITGNPVAAGSATRPVRALCFSLVTKAWYGEQFSWQMGHGTRFAINGQSRLLAGGPSDQVYLVNEGTSDGISTAIRGTATAATSTTLTDSGASFTTAVVGAPVAIVAGTGKGQVRIITSRPSSTQIGVAAWNTTPDATSFYLIGAITLIAQTGIFNTEVQNNNTQRAVRLNFEPTEHACTLDAQLYLNHNANPTPFSDSFAVPDDTVTITNGSVNAVVNLKSYTSDRYDGSGFSRFQFNNPVINPRPKQAWASLRLQGFGGLDRVKIYEATIEGAGD